MTDTVDSGLSGADLATRPGDDLEHERILAAVHAGLFGRPPLQIDHYRIERLLGAGGMGEVFLAWDESLQRHVALKVLRAGIGDAELLRQEALALARLSDPHVVQVHELGEHEGRTYVVMERVDGPTLRRWVADREPGWRETLALLRSAGEGLAAAHGVGVIHRDFKPDNVLVGDDGRVRVVDFGLALSAGESGPARLAGTPAYMAPEQLDGVTIDARADQFAFCVTAAELLGAEDPRRPTGGRPAWLWRALRRGLAEDPRARFADMRELLAALDDRRRRRRRAVLGLAGLAALVVGLSWSIREDVEDPCAALDRELAAVWSPDRAEAVRARFVELDAELGPTAAERTAAALDEWARAWTDVRTRGCRDRHAGRLAELSVARRDACLLDQRRRVDALVDALAEADHRTLAYARELASSLPVAEVCEQDEALRLGIDPPAPAEQAEVDELRALLAEAGARRLTGHPEANLAALAVAHERGEALGYAPLMAEILVEQAAAELMIGSPARGVDLLEDAAHRAYRARNDRLAARLWTELSLHAVSELDAPARGRDWLTRARDTWARIGLDDEAHASLAFAAGALALERGELDEAERELERARDLQVKLRDRGAEPFVLARLALLAETRGEPDRGRGLRARAVEVASDWFGPLHPRTIGLRIDHALALSEAEQIQPARAELDRALAAWRRGGSVAQPDLGYAWLVLASLELAEGRADAAAEAAREAAAIYDQATPGDLDGRAQAHNALGVAEHERGEHRAAAAAFAEAEALLREAGTDPAFLAATRVNLALDTLALGDLDAAARAFEAALAVGPDTVARLGLAEIALRQDRPADALAQLGELGDELGPVEQIDHDLLRGLAQLRLDRRPTTGDRLARALAAADAHDRAAIFRNLELLNATTRERSELGIDQPNDPTSQP